MRQQKPHTVCWWTRSADTGWNRPTHRWQTVLIEQQTFSVGRKVLRGPTVNQNTKPCKYTCTTQCTVQSGRMTCIRVVCITGCCRFGQCTVTYSRAEIVWTQEGGHAQVQLSLISDTLNSLWRDISHRLVFNLPFHPRWHWNTRCSSLMPV